MTITPEDAIAAYNHRSKTDYTRRVLQQHETETADRVKVANKLNALLGLDGHDEIVWNQMPCVMIGLVPVFIVTAHGYQFVAYIERDREWWTRQKPYVVVQMRVAPWGKIEAYNHNPAALRAIGFRRVWSTAGFGEAVLIADLEAQMPDRLRSKNPKVNDEDPSFYSTAQMARMASGGFGRPASERYITADNDVEGYRSMLTLYQAERGVATVPSIPALTHEKYAAVQQNYGPEKRTRWMPWGRV